MTSQPLELESLGPPPRRIRPRKRQMARGIGCLQLFLVPFILIGLGCVITLLGTLSLWCFGQETNGRVIDRSVSEDSESSSYRIEYAFSVGTKEYHARDSVNADVYSRALISQSTTVKFLPFAPGAYSIALLPGRSEAGSVGLVLFFTLFWNGIVSVFVWIAYVLPAVHRRLYKSGRIAMGTITDKKISTGEDSLTYTLHYEFMPDFTTTYQPIPGRAAVTAEEYHMIKPGDRLTILYDPRKPHRNLAYRFGGYEVADHVPD